MTAVHRLAEYGRLYVASCTCGWSQRSGSVLGAHVAASGHLDLFGAAGHVVVVTP